MKKLKILFFGKLKETWNTDEIIIETGSNDIASLYEELLKRTSEAPHKESIKIAINDEFVNWNSEVKDNDTIAFLPPSSGG